jgi:hypothetical protein
MDRRNRKPNRKKSISDFFYNIKKRIQTGMSELDAILNELTQANDPSKVEPLTPPAPLIDVSATPPNKSDNVEPVSTPLAPLYLSYSSSSSKSNLALSEVLSFSAPLPFDIGISSLFGCAFHAPHGSTSPRGATPHAPPHPFIEVQRRRAFEKLKANFTSLLDRHLSAAKLKGKSGPSSGSGKAAFERWHFAVKLSESIVARESSYYRVRRSQNQAIPASTSFATWVTLKDSISRRVEAEIRNLQANNNPGQTNPPAGIEFGVEPILMSNMERAKKKYKVSVRK